MTIIVCCGHLPHGNDLPVSYSVKVLTARSSKEAYGHQSPLRRAFGQTTRPAARDGHLAGPILRDHVPLDPGRSCEVMCHLRRHMPARESAVQTSESERARRDPLEGQGGSTPPKVLRDHNESCETSPRLRVLRDTAESCETSPSLARQSCETALRGRSCEITRLIPHEP